MHWHNEYQPIINGQTSVHYNVLPINHQNTNIIVLTYYLITKPSIELVHPPFLSTKITMSNCYNATLTHQSP